MEENKKQTPYDDNDMPHDDPAPENNDELTPEELREAIEMFKRFKMHNAWFDKMKNDAPDVDDDDPEDAPWNRPQEPPFHRPFDREDPYNRRPPFDASDDDDEDDDLPPWQHHDHFDPPPYWYRHPHGPHAGFGAPPHQGGFGEPGGPFGTYRPWNAPPFGWDLGQVDTRAWPPRKTNRYVIRTSTYTGFRNMSRLRMVAFAIWILGFVGAILTACLTAQSFASALLIIFWVMAAAGVLGSLVYLLCQPLEDFLTTCDYLQNMYVEQIEFAEEEKEP